MIVHNIAFKLKETDPKLKADQAAEFKRRIESLAGKIPGLQSLKVALDVGKVDDHFDLVLISTHESIEDLESYQADPLHAAVIEYGKTIVSARACVDYEA